MKLPFEKEPLIDYQNHHAYMTGILGQFPHCIPWILSEYIHIFSIADPGDLMCEYSVEQTYFADGGALRLALFESDTDGFRGLAPLLSKERLIELLKYFIGNGYYLYGDLNERYIPCQLAYDTDEDLVHNYMICGYDEERHMLDYASYDKKRKFAVNAVPLDCFYDGLLHANVKNRLIFCKANEEYDFRFRISKVIRSLKAYVRSERLDGEHNNEEFVYGIGVMYKLMHIFLVEGYPLQDKKNHDMIFLRALLNHKRLLTQLMRYLYENHYILDDQYASLSEQIYERMRVVYHLFIKWCASGSRDIQQRLYLMLRTIVAEEKQYIGNLCTELEENFSQLDALPYDTYDWLEPMECIPTAQG